MTDEQLLALLEEKYPALFDALPETAGMALRAALADLRRLIADTAMDVVAMALRHHVLSTGVTPEELREAVDKELAPPKPRQP